MLRFVVLAALAACGASFNPSGLDYHPEPSSHADDRRIDTVSLACLGGGDHADRFVPCDGGAVPHGDALVVVWFHGDDGTQWPAERFIELNDVELEATRHVTVDGEAIPVFALADAFPALRRGQDLPPARYHVRVQVISITGPSTMAEQDVVIQ